MKKILIVFLLVSETGSAQPTINNDLAHRRYWFYRTRFINDFIKIGDQQGDCICFAERNNTFHDAAKIGPDQIDITNQYLSTLALEYQILKRSNQSTKETIREIFYLVKTINRLDARADWFWPPSIPPATDNMIGYPQNAFLNGFMLREDMPKSYITQTVNPDNFNHFNYAIKEYTFTGANDQWGFCGLDKITRLTNDNKFSNFVGFPGNIPGEPLNDLPLVHDKYYSMFVAFMFIIKYLPDNTGYYDENNQLQYFQDGEWDIKKEVRNITNRCVPYIRGNLFGNSASNWILEYPTGTNLVIGAPMLPFSYPTAKIICNINSSYPWSSNIASCVSYYDFASLNASGSYQFLTASTGLTEDNSVFLANCQVGSNLSWGSIPIWIAMANNSSSKGIEWADLMRKVLHQNGGIMKQKSVYATPINEANCVGPFNFGNCDSPCEWSSPDRLEHPKRRGQGCSSSQQCGAYPGFGDNVDFSGNYPGVDYMLLHNLYYEFLNQLDDNGDAQNAKYKNASNLMDNIDKSIWPLKAGNFTYGVNLTSQNTGPAYIKLFQNLTSHAQIYATASPWAPFNTIPSNVEYRAGKEITLLPEDPTTNSPGFEVKAGSNFHAYIQRYICGQSDYNNGMKQANNGEEVHSSDYESDDMNTEIPIHYVEYPELSDADKYPFMNHEETSTNYDPVKFQEMDEQILIQQINDKNNISNNNWENLQRFEVMPNPSTGQFKIIVNKIDSEETFSIIILDMKGNLVHSNSNFISSEVDLSKLAKGIYMIQLKSSLGKTYSKRLSLIE